MERSEFVRIFKALSVETRVRIVELLLRRPLCVNALAARLEVTPAAVSQHLRVLREAAILVADKRGYFVHYRVNGETLDRFREGLEGLLSTRQ
jgi:DNA-binding transcriptional ArsR family regulator